jgi:thymidine kinase
MTEVKGSIHVRVGPMFAGKSTYLLQQYRKYSRKYPTMIIKYSLDNRYSEEGIGTHDNVVHSENVIISDKNIWNIFEKTMPFKVVCIEEGQFYTGLVSFCESLANQGKRVIIVGLDGDYMRVNFGEIHQLLPISESFKKINAVCAVADCDNAAAFTAMLHGNSIKDNNELIGGAETYQAVCRFHHPLFKLT